MSFNGLRKRGGHERVRVHKGVMGKRPDLRARRVRLAKERQAEYDKLSTEQKITLLDRGGFVAHRQRAKLAALLIAEREQKKARVTKVKSN